MGRWVMVELAPVVRRRDDRAVQDDDSADGHLSFCGRTAGLFERKAHEALVCFHLPVLLRAFLHASLPCRARMASIRIPSIAGSPRLQSLGPPPNQGAASAGPRGAAC